MTAKFSARPITARTKGELKRLRRNGYVPVSVQHRGEETLHLEMESKPLNDFIRRYGETAIVDLAVEPGNKPQSVIVHGIQRDPVTSWPLQVIFQKIAKGDSVKTHVPIVLVGEPEEVHEGTGVVQRSTEQLEIRCLPQNLPDHVTVDISGLTHLGPIRVADIDTGGKFEILTAPDTVVATITAVPQAPPEDEEEANTTPEPAEADQDQQEAAAA
jgi:large subunit ribosomal protein L25